MDGHVTWACDEKIGILRRKGGDGNGITGEKEERKTQEKTVRKIEG